MFLGAAAKEVIVAAPLMAFLHEWIFGRERPGEILRRSKVLYGGLLLGLVFLLAMVAGGGTSAKAYAGQDQYTGLQYLANQPPALLHYLRLALVPYGLSFDYGWPSDGLYGWPWPRAGLVIASALPLAAAFLAALWGAWRRRAWSFPVLGFFAVLAPTSSIIPLWCVAAEQRMYLPLAFLAALFVCGLFALVRRLSGDARPVFGAFAILALVLGGSTFVRNSAYATELSIWADTVRKLPGNSRAWTNLGKALYYAGRKEEARAALTRAVALKPDLPAARRDLGALLAELGDLPAGLAQLEKAHELTPKAPDIPRVTGEVLLKEGKSAEAVGYFLEALRLDPSYRDARRGLGAAYLASGLAAKAVAEFRRLADEDPSDTDARVNLAVALFVKGDPGGAEAALSEAHRRDPASDRAAMALAELYEKEGRRADAEALYREVLHMHPGHPGALEHLSLLMTR